MGCGGFRKATRDVETGERMNGFSMKEMTRQCRDVSSGTGFVPRVHLQMCQELATLSRPLHEPFTSPTRTSGVWSCLQSRRDLLPWCVSRWERPLSKSLVCFLGLLFVGCFHLEWSCSGQPSSANESNSPTDTLKEFLASPPAIKEFIFKRRELYQPLNPGAPEVDTNAFQFYYAKWQGTDFILRQLSSEEQLEDLGVTTNSLIRAWGKNGFTFWKLVGDNYVFWQDEKHAYSSQYVALERLPQDEQVLVEVSAMRNVLLQAVNMGIGQLRENTLTWAENSFTAESQSRDPLVGDLLLKGGFPSEIHYRVKGESGMSVVELAYAGQNTTIRLPQRITYGYAQPNGSRIPIAEFEIISLRLSSSRIASAEFSKDSLFISGFTKTIQQDGGSLYWTNSGGTVVDITSSATSTRGRSENRRWVVIGVLVLSVSIFAFLLWGIPRKRGGSK